METPKFHTTEEEIEGSQIVKAILREILPWSRIAFTDPYFGILLDDNCRKPIAVYILISPNKYVEFFNNGKTTEKKINILCRRNL
jgi:hypothetical protein